MGVKIFELTKPSVVELQELSGRTLAIDSPLFLYQFLSTIRKPDGSLLTDSKGRVTSHLIGLFNRTTKLLQLGIKPAFVFDGKPHALKGVEIKKRIAAKIEAEKLYKKAAAKKEEAGMLKYATRTAKLTKEMTEEAKKLVEYLGAPVVISPSEGECQAAHMVKKGDCWAVASQDADVLVFGATRLLRNLAISGRRKFGKGFGTVQPELIEIKNLLNSLGIDQEQLIALAMLVGTDYNTGGIRGLGPNKALKLVKQHGKNFSKLFDSAKWNDYFDFSWKTVFELFANPKVTEKYTLSWKKPDRKALLSFLVDEHDFNRERVEKAIDKISGEEKGQKGLGDFT